ncbi:ribonuclease H-like domain-containing protein [Tanacetum coccineum]
MWKLRIEQYFQVQDYALWDVIENGNSFKLVARRTANADGTSTSTIPGPVTTEEKAQKKNDVKAINMLLMALPNEHLLTFNQYKDSNTLFATIHARFGGNDATKKTQKTLLKQMYENFNATSTESLDSIFNRLQKIVSQLAILALMNIQVSIVSTPVSTASTHVNTANLSDANIYAFLANHPNGSQLVHEDLAQIHEDDLEEMDLKWQLALVSMRARRYYQRTGKKITINGSDTAGYDKSKVECFNCHNMGHFARECREMVAIDGAGFDWRFMANEEVPTNMALMAFLDSEKNEVMFCEQIDVLKRDITYKDSDISVLNYELEELRKEKESNKLKIDKFENASKCLDKLIRNQITDNSRKGIGYESYNVIPPPPTGLFAPLTIDLSNSGLEEFQQPKFEGYGPKASKSVCVETSNEVKKTSDASLVEELVSKKEKQTIFPTKIDLVKQQENPARKPVKLTAIITKGKECPKIVKIARPNLAVVNAVRGNQGYPQNEDQRYVNSGCSRHMTGNMSYLLDYKEFDGRYVTFGGGAKGGRITGKGTLKTVKLDFEDVYFVNVTPPKWVAAE